MSDERELKQLYQAMRSEDARHAPSFTRVLQRPTAANLGYLRAVAITVALVVVVAMFAVNALRRRDVPPQVAQTPASSVKAHVAAGAPARPAAEAAAATKTTSPRPAARRQPPAASSIDDWKSPTDAWLQTPDESFRNSVPSLSYSSVNLSD